MYIENLYGLATSLQEKALECNYTLVPHRKQGWDEQPIFGKMGVGKGKNCELLMRDY
jgi:hypothetical protein